MIFCVDVGALFGAEVERVVVCHVALFAGELVEQLLAGLFVRHEDFFLGVDEVIGACCEVSPVSYTHLRAHET